MPFINVKVTETICDSKAEQIKSQLGKAIEKIPGKSEAYLMVSLEPDCKLYFKGSDEPCAFAEVKILGKSTKNAYQSLTQEICSILENELNISQDRTYVKFEEVEYWGYNGFMF